VRREFPKMSGACGLAAVLACAVAGCGGGSSSPSAGARATATPAPRLLDTAKVASAIAGSIRS